MNLIRLLTKQNPLVMALSFLMIAGSLFGETVVFSGRARQHDILLLLNPPFAQLFVKDLNKEDIHDYSLTFDGTNLYYLHDTWKSLEAKGKLSEQDQFAIVQYEPLLQNGGLPAPSPLVTGNLAMPAKPYFDEFELPSSPAPSGEFP